MKEKICVLLIIIVAALGLTACNAVDENGKLNLSFVENMLAQELGEEAAKEIMDVIELAYKAQETEESISYDSQAGAESQIGAEGITGTESTDGAADMIDTESMVITESEWSAEQGKPVVIDENTFDETWPDCTYTRLVPKPDMGVKLAEVKEDGLRVVFTDDTTIEQIRTYVDAVIEAGFNNSVEIDPRMVDNLPRYKYMGYHSYGYLAEIYFSIEEKSLHISE